MVNRDKTKPVSFYPRFTVHRLPLSQSHQHYFRRDAEAHRDDARPDPAADEQVPSVFDDVPHRVTLSELRRHDGSPDERQTNLSAVRVPGQRERNARRNVGEDVRVVRQ